MELVRNPDIATNPAPHDYTYDDGVWGSCDLVYAYCSTANH